MENEKTENSLEEDKIINPDLENAASAEPVDGGAGDELQKLKDELAESKDKYVRLYAEFDNYRRRTAKEKLGWLQTANENLIRTLLPVIDDFERAEKSFSKESKEAEGFFLIQNKLKKILEQYQVKSMEAAGADFNADFHEAITQIPVEDDALKGKVVEVVEKGYLLNDKVIRFAKVVVGN